MNALRRALVLTAAGLFCVGLLRAILDLPPSALRLADAVALNLDASGVRHPVTAVLLNFRGYDTLLEIAVMLLALLGVLTAETSETPGARHVMILVESILQGMASLLAPLMLLTAGYLLWAGAHQPGGAFQAASVLAAGGVLLRLAGLLPVPPAPARLLRLGLVLGMLVFLIIAALGLTQGALLHYPRAAAGRLILLIETGLTLSLALLLAGLFLWLPRKTAQWSVTE